MTLPKNTTRKIVPLLLLFIVGCFVVFYQFLSIPKNTTFDEIEFAKLALQLGKQPYAPYSQLATGHATFYFYLILLSFKLFGVGLFALRFPAALFGILNPLVFYLLLKKMFKNYLPLLLSLIFISLRWYFNFARFGFEVTFLLFLELSSLYFMFRFLEKKKYQNLIISGIFAGLAYNSYQPGRIFILIPLLLFFSSIIKNRAILWKSAVYFLVPFFLLVLPLIIYLNIHKDTRFYQQFYPDNHEMTLEEKGQFFMRNLTSTSGIFNVNGDVNGRHNYPNKAALNPILGLMFLVGLLLAIIKIKERNNQLFLLWFFLSLAPTLVTYPWENPNMLRTFTVIPSVVYFIGLTIKQLSNISFLQKPVLKKVFLVVIVIIVSASSFYELRTYFVHQAQVFKEAFEAQRDITSYLQ